MAAAAGAPPDAGAGADDVAPEVPPAPDGAPPSTPDGAIADPPAPEPDKAPEPDNAAEPEPVAAPEPEPQPVIEPEPVADVEPAASPPAAEPTVDTDTGSDLRDHPDLQDQPDHEDPDLDDRLVEHDLGAQPAVTVTPLDDELLAARATARRHRRQTLTFLAAFVLVLCTGAGAFASYQGLWTLPFGSEPAAAVVSCASADDLVPAKDVALRVYNATKRSGLATKVGRSMTSRGFDVTATANDPLGETVRTSAVLRYGPAGQLAAHTVAAHVKGKVTRVEDDRMGETVDLVLGDRFGMNTAAEAKKALGATAAKLGATCRSTPSSTAGTATGNAATTPTKRPSVAPTTRATDPAPTTTGSAPTTASTG